MQGEIGDYYAVIGGTLLPQMFEPGQFFHAPALFGLENGPIREVQPHYDERAGTLTFGVMEGGMELLEAGHNPIKAHGVELRESEHFVMVRCKTRPVVLVSPAADRWNDQHRRHEECFVVAPVYSFDGAGKERAYSDEFVDQVKHYEYHTFFYLPAHKERPPISEGFVRFDKLQVLPKGLLKHTALRLDADALNCFEAWLSAYVARDLSEEGCPGVSKMACAPEWLEAIDLYRRPWLTALGLLK